MAKSPKSLKLDPELESEILDLKGTYVGANLSEIITFMLKDWLKTNRDYVKDLKRDSRKRGRRKHRI